MPTGERVVLRTPWSVVLVNAAPVFAPLLLVTLIFDHSIWVFVRFLSAFGVVALVHRYLFWTVLTPEGLVLRRLWTRLVPWNHIGAVDRTPLLWGDDRITVWVLTDNSNRHLPAPSMAFGIGSGAVAAAHALVEQWWIANRGPAPAVNPEARTPPAAAGR